MLPRFLPGDMDILAHSAEGKPIRACSSEGCRHLRAVLRFFNRDGFPAKTIIANVFICVHP
jgi:hypothetical protein